MSHPRAAFMEKFNLLEIYPSKKIGVNMAKKLTSSQIFIWMLEVVRLSEAYVKNSRQYNLRKRPGENYQIGDKVWKKNHVLSNAAEGFAAKLAPAYILCTVHRVISPLVYQLVDKDGKNVGKYHMKDLKRYRGSEDEDQ
ncbi:hypothetical protein JTB14_030166 [Gonioctena quinquepunctata]|nr:hypothetical protein JTB14_030166 [Gonioctena quinquepunctata]